ncbi:LysR substrate binding domain-containing protein [Paenibacillus sp. PDC88]|nr:LysR substrate binding domain-containing protein [Paenibacillus sp. PDC88]
MDEARSAVHENDHLISGTLTISANEVLCAYRLPTVFQQFRSRYPGVRLIFRSVPNQELKQTLFEGTADVVFMLDEGILSTGLTVEPLLEETFRFFVAPDHPLAERNVLQLEDFHGEVFLVNEKGCTYRTMFDARLRKRELMILPIWSFKMRKRLNNVQWLGSASPFFPK